MSPEPDHPGSVRAVRRWLGTPAALALAAAIVSSLFVVARLSSLSWDASRFVLAGEALSDPHRVPKGLYVLRGATGYDGQAYYRLALDPLTNRRIDHGITLDTPSYRQQRIGYPALAWLSSGGGRPRALPWAMIAINVASLAALGWLGGAMALALGRSAWAGSVFFLYPGFVVSLARDLSEPMAAAFMLGGLYLLRRSRPNWAALALTFAILTRETTAVVPIGLAIAWAFATVRPGRAKPPLRSLAVPLSVFAGWQLFLASRWHSLAVLANENATDPPFTGLGPNVKRFIETHSILMLAEIAALAVFVVIVLVMMRSDRVRSYERWAFLVAAAIAVSLDHTVWEDHAHFLRAVTEFFVVGSVLVLAAMRPRRTILLVAPVVLLWAPVVRIFAREL